MSADHETVTTEAVAHSWPEPTHRPILRDFEGSALAIGIMFGADVEALAEITPEFALVFAEYLIAAARKRLVEGQPAAT
jgi:hypothetical protein